MPKRSKVKPRPSVSNSAVPILLIIGRYEISQANAVKCMGNATFIIAPFDKKELQDKIVEARRGVE